MLVDLPNEIFLLIFQNLNMTDVLYTFVDINHRLNQLIYDPFYIRNLDMTSMKMKSFFDRTYSIEKEILDGICSNILPRICHQINHLTVEQYSIECVLHNINYPQLHSLTLIDFPEDVLLNCLTSKLFQFEFEENDEMFFLSIKVIELFRNFWNKSNILKLISTMNQPVHLLKLFCQYLLCFCRYVND